MCCMSNKLTTEEYQQIKKNLIKKLYANRAFRKGHLLYETLNSGIPRHLAGYVILKKVEIFLFSTFLVYWKLQSIRIYFINFQ